MSTVFLSSMNPTNLYSHLGRSRIEGYFPSLRQLCFLACSINWRRIGSHSLKHRPWFSPSFRKPMPELVLQEAAGLFDKSFCNLFNGIYCHSPIHPCFEPITELSLCVVLRH